MWAKSSWCLGQRRRTRAGAGRPSGPGKRSWEATFCWPPDPCISSSIRIALSSLPQRSPVMTSLPPWSFSLVRAAPLPLSCPLRRLGSDHLDVWALPRGQGGSEGGLLLPAPTLSPGLLCCFCAKASQSLPILFCELPPLLHLPSCPCPTTSPKNSNVSSGYGANLCESSMSLFCPSVPSTRANQRPPLNSLASLHGLILLSRFLSTIGLLPPPGFVHS